MSIRSSSNKWIEKISRDLLDKFVEELKSPEHMKMIEDNLLQPIIQHTFQKMYPYIIVTSIVFFLTFILAVAILFLIIRSNNMT